MGGTKRAKKTLNDSHGFIALLTLFDFSFSGSQDKPVILDSYCADFVSVNKNAKIECGQNPNILTSCLVNNTYLSYLWQYLWVT